MTVLKSKSRTFDLTFPFKILGSQDQVMISRNRFWLSADSGVAICSKLRAFDAEMGLLFGRCHLLSALTAAFVRSSKYFDEDTNDFTLAMTRPCLKHQCPRLLSRWLNQCFSKCTCLQLKPK
jgi:hypothetical protein